MSSVTVDLECFCPIMMMSIPLQKQLGTTLHKSQQRIDQRIKKWQDLRQAVESVKVSKKRAGLKSLGGFQCKLHQSRFLLHPISTLLKQSSRRTSGSSLSSCSPLRGSTTKSRRSSAPTKRPPWLGGRYCSTAWRKRSLYWGRNTLTWRNSHTLMTTYTFYRWASSEYPQHLACLLDLLCHQPFHLLIVELAISVGPLGIWRPQQHQRGSILLLWRYQESYCFAENTSWRNQQDGNEQNLRSRWGNFSFFVSSRIDVRLQRVFLMSECC